MPPTLFIVPIGNLQDITLRALEVLKSADFIICEDTRQTIKLLNHYNFSKELISFHTHNQLRRIPEILSKLKSCRSAALVTDGGTPGISDPSLLLVKKFVEEKIEIVPLPGPSAVLTAFTASGIDSDGFIFLGFLKRKAGKIRKELESAAALGKAVIFYESPYRIKKTIKLCIEVFGAGAPVAVARELTKKFEEIIRGTLQEVSDIMENKNIKGEITVVVAPRSAE